MDDVKSRLLQFADSQNFPKCEFYKKISIAQSNFSGSGTNSALSTDKIRHILNIFPDLNSDWLLLGRGEMLRSASQSIGNITHSTAVGVNVNGNDININNNPLVPAMDNLSKSVAALASANADLVSENARLSAEVSRLTAIIEKGTPCVIYNEKKPVTNL